jgi:hypothetical protein
LGDKVVHAIVYDKDVRTREEGNDDKNKVSGFLLHFFPIRIILAEINLFRGPEHLLLLFK